jgi:putative DNA primase/helicase
VLPPSEYPVLIVEGGSDVLAAMSLGLVGIGRPSALAGIEILTQMPLSGREVWIIGENDAGAGREGMLKTFAVVRSMTHIVKCIMPPESIKDLRAWYNQGLSFDGLTGYVKDHAEALDVDDPNVFADGQPATMAKGFLKERYKSGDSYTLRNYREDWYTWEDSRYLRTSASTVRGQIYDYLTGKSFIKETKNGRAVLPVPVTQATAYNVLDTMFMPGFCPVYANPPSWITRRDMPDPKNLIVFKNGILDVAEYMAGRVKVYSVDPDLFVMNTFPYDFDEDARSPFIEDYFKEIFNGDSEKIRLLQQWFGYNCVPDMTQEKMMLFTGRPRSGKSTTLDMMRGMLGQDQCCALQMTHLISRFGRAPMLGKLAAIFSDVKTPRANEANVALEMLLAIIGQDAVPIDRKNIEELPNVNLFCRFTMTMNDLPAFSDHARALTPRMNVIGFPNTYVGKENRGLKGRLEDEAKAGKLIPWALAGLKDLREQGRFIEPADSAELIRVMELTTSPALMFVSCLCSLDDSYQVLKSELFEAWRNWCATQGLKNVGMEGQFGRWLLSAAPGIKTARLRAPCPPGTSPRLRSDAGSELRYYYTGIRLTPEARREYLT